MELRSGGQRSVKLDVLSDHVGVLGRRGLLVFESHLAHGAGALYSIPESVWKELGKRSLGSKGAAK